MDGLWQTIIGGLAVAAITGLSVIAYRHPAAYARIYRPLVCVLVGTWAIWFIYGLGYSSGFSDAVLTTMKLNSGGLIKTPDRDLPSLLPYMVPAIAYAYLSLLKLLPYLLSDQAPSSEKDRE
jgi:MFS superfamily sulfate permease-like transporter